MSYMDEYNALEQKRKKGNINQSAISIGGSVGSSYMDQYNAIEQKRLKAEGKAAKEDKSGHEAPLGLTVGTLQLPQYNSNRFKNAAPFSTDVDFFQKGAFEDGYQFGDVTRAILGTAGDAGLNVVKGIAGIGEGIGDAIVYGIAGISDAVGNEENADRLRRNAQVILVDEFTKGAEDYLNQYSILGRTSDALAQGLGQVAAITAIRV